MAFYYVQPNEDAALTATVTASAADGAYPAANIVNGIPSKPAKLTTATGYWQFDLGSAKQIYLVALIHHNLVAAQTISLIGTDNPANFGSPTVSTVITIPAPHEDGYTTNAWSASIANNALRYWRIVVGTSNGSVLPAIGEVILASALHTLERGGLGRNAQRAETRLTKEQKTDGGTVLHYDYGVTERSLTGDVIASATGIASIMSWWRSCKGRMTPTLIVPDSSADAWYCLFTQPNINYKRQSRFGLPVTLAFTEAPRGLAL